MTKSPPPASPFPQGEQPSFATALDDRRLSAPSALRNRDAILQQLNSVAPKQGKALEIASGTGEHLARFAPAFPDLTWQPSDPDPARRQSIAAHTESLDNVLPAINLDATDKGWAGTLPAQDLVVLVNLLHLIATPAAKTLIAETAQALRPGGCFFLYGPFLRDGKPTSDGDARFDERLRAQDPNIGYKDLDTVKVWMENNGLLIASQIDMPANNIALVAKRPR